MKLWLLRACSKGEAGYDVWDAIVVAADTEAEARLIPPTADWEYEDWQWPAYGLPLTVRYLGEAADDVEAGLVLDSFNAG